MPNPQSVGGDDDVFIIQQNEVNEALYRVQKAMSKASDVTECVSCGDDIPEERKLAVPSTELCIYCASKAERRK